MGAFAWARRSPEVVGSSLARGEEKGKERKKKERKKEREEGMREKEEREREGEKNGVSGFKSRIYSVFGFSKKSFVFDQFTMKNK